MRTIIIIAAIVIVVGVAVGGIYYGYHWYTTRQAETPQDEAIVSIPQGLGDIPETTEIEPTLSDEPGLPPLEAPTGEPPATEGSGLEPGPSLEGEGDVGMGDLAGDLTSSPAAARDIPDLGEPSRTDPRDTRPATTTSSGTRPTTQPATTQPVIQPTDVAAVTTEGQPSSAVETTTPLTTTTQPSAPAATPAPARGNYSVRTLEPVLESKLATVRKAMKSLGIQLLEQKTSQQNLQAYKLALGYFRTKAEAESWAQYNFQPRGIEYYVYPIQGMYSIQVGVYSQPQNVEVAMRELYRKFPGVRLPIRREITTLSRAAYSLSISRITQPLAEKIWRELNRLGIPAEISGV